MSETEPRTGDLTSGPLWSVPGFRALVIVSGASHVLLAVGLWIAPRSYSTPMMPAPVMVEVMASLPTPPAATAPTPAPPAEVPPAAAPPRQQVEEAVVIPEQPRPKPKPPKPAPAPPPKKEQKPEKPKDEKPPRSAADLMAALRQDVEAREPATEPASGPGLLDPEVAAFIRRVKACVYTNWVGARQYMRRPNLSVLFRVRLSAAGAVQSVELSQSSGIRALDETAERAIYKCSPLPEPPGGASMVPMRFVPGEMT